jgi:hypothetical protein
MGTITKPVCDNQAKKLKKDGYEETTKPVYDKKTKKNTHEGKTLDCVDGVRYFIKEKKQQQQDDNNQDDNNQDDNQQTQVGDCGNKVPWQVVTDLGLNFRAVQKKWIDSGCMGTSPCSYDEARRVGRTNINLKNAICSGKWDPKKGTVSDGGNDGSIIDNLKLPKGALECALKNFEISDIAKIPADCLKVGVKVISTGKMPTINDKDAKMCAVQLIDVVTSDEDTQQKVMNFAKCILEGIMNGTIESKTPVSGNCDAKCQKTKFDEWISLKQISKGYLQKVDPYQKDKAGINFYEYGYIKKYPVKKNEKGEIISVDETNAVPIANFNEIKYDENHIYVVLYYDGIFGYLVMEDGELRDITDAKQTWEPQKRAFVPGKEETVKESIINRILSDILSEQKINWSSIVKNFSGDGTIKKDDGTIKKDDGTIKKDQGNLPQYKVDGEKLCSYVDPKRNEAIKILEGMRDMEINLGFTKIPLVDKDARAKLQVSIDQLKQIDCKTVCDEKNSALLSDAKTQIKQQQQTNPNAKSVKKELERLLTLITEIENECKRLQQEKINFENSQKQDGSKQDGSKQDGSKQDGSKQDGSKQDPNDLLKKFGFVKPDGRIVDPKMKIEKLGKQKTGESGSGTLQSAIDNSSARSYYFVDYNDLVSSVGLGDEYKLKHPMSSPTSPGQVITKENESELMPLEDVESKAEYTKETFGKYLGTSSTLEIFIGKRQGSVVASSQTRCPFDDAGARKTLMRYLANAINGENTSPKSGEKEQLCACFKGGKFDNFQPIKDEDWAKNNIALSKFNRPRGLIFNRVLTWNDVKSLMYGKSIGGNSLGEAWRDLDFATTACFTPLKESLRNRVKNRISEAVSSKKVLTESLKYKILRDITKRY